MTMTTEEQSGEVVARAAWTTASDAATKSWFLPVVNVAAWIGLVWLAFAVAPPVPADAPIDTSSLVLGSVFWMAAIGAGSGLLMRERWAYGLTTIGGATLFLGAGACLAAGHTGVWIGVQALAGAGLMATGLASWRVSR